MQAAISEWINWLTVDKSLATVRGYEWDVRALVKTVPAGTRDRPDAYTLADLTGYLAERRRAGIGDSARKRAVAAFRSFFGFHCPQNNVAKGLPFPRIKRKSQRTLDEDQVLAVLAACETTTATGMRDLALLCLALDSGLRSSEVCRLALADVDFEKRRFKVIVKGGNEGSGSFSASTGEFLQRWVAVRQARKGVQTLFVGIGGIKPGTSLTPWGLRAIFRRLGQKAGLTNGFSPHDLRRTFATLALRRGAPTRIVQEAGRWENIGMVELYSRAITLDDFDRYSPVEGVLRR